MNFKTSEAKKIKGRYCCAYNCTNEPANKKGGLCHKHYRRKRRELDPVGVRYTEFKGNAKKRNKEFHISLEEFRAWCTKTGYLKPYIRGYRATIDRIDNRFGYYIWNIQLLDNRANASKGASLDELIQKSNDKKNEVPF